MLHNTKQEEAMKSKVIHCRLTEDQHSAIVEAAKKADLSITEFVVRAVLGEPAKAVG